MIPKRGEDQDCADKLINLLTPKDWNGELDKSSPSIYKKLQKPLNIYIKTSSADSDSENDQDSKTAEINNIILDLNDATKLQKQVLAKFGDNTDQKLFSYSSVEDSEWCSTLYLRGKIKNKDDFTLYIQKNIVPQARPLPQYNSNHSYYGPGSSAKYASPPSKPWAPINDLSKTFSLP